MAVFYWISVEQIVGYWSVPAAHRAGQVQQGEDELTPVLGDQAVIGYYAESNLMFKGHIFDSLGLSKLFTLAFWVLVVGWYGSEILGGRFFVSMATRWFLGILKSFCFYFIYFVSVVIFSWCR